MRTLLLALAFGALASPVAAEPLDRARALLQGIDTAPPADAVRALGPDAAASLVQIAGDAATPMAVRARAVWALGAVPDDAGLAYLRALLSDPDAPAMLRRAAPAALCTGWSDAALPLVAAALADADPQLRNQAARALGRSGTDAARAALDARRAVEADPMVRAAIDAARGGGAR